MHELSVTESILEIALRHANQAKAKQITRLNLVIGQLASIVDDSVQFYWDIIAKDTIAEGASLHFKRIPTKLICLNCGTEYEMSDSNLTCPSCESDQVKIVAGKEFYLESIDVQ
jgi:hydrogenase nickel incorporation protein HypA/HybF